MKKLYADLFLFAQKVNRNHVRLIITILTLVMLVIGAGAPDDGGDGNH